MDILTGKVHQIKGRDAKMPLLLRKAVHRFGRGIEDRTEVIKVSFHPKDRRCPFQLGIGVLKSLRLERRFVISNDFIHLLLCNSITCTGSIYKREYKKDTLLLQQQLSINLTNCLSQL